MRNVIQASRPYPASSSKSQLMRILYSLKYARRQERDSCRTKQLRCSRKRILSIFGTFSRNICHNLRIQLRESTMISSFMCLQCYRPSVDSSSLHQLSWNLRGMSSVELRLCLSSIMSSERSICSRLASRYPCMTPQAMVTWRKKILRTTSLSWCQLSPSSSNWLSHFTHSTSLHQ